MNCPRCGNNILPGEGSCSKCGLIFINSAVNQETNTPSINNNNNNSINDITSENTNNNVISNNLDNVISTSPNNNIGIVNSNIDNGNMEQIVQEEPINLEGYFVGKNYAKIKKRKWSWNTLIFGFLYTLYRKMILISLVWIGIDVASVIIMKKYSIIVIVALNVIMSFLVNYIYLALGNTKIDNIKRKYWGHSIDELIYRCSKKGGTSGLPVFFCGFAGVAACIVGLFLYMAFYPQYYIDRLYYRVPSDFEASSSDKENYSSFQYADNINFCNIVASKEEGYDSLDSYIEEKTVNYSEENVKREPIKILGRKWQFIDVTFTENSHSYFYVTEDNGIIYNYEFNIYNGFGKKCESYYKYVKYSMSIR